MIKKCYLANNLNEFVMERLQIAIDAYKKLKIVRARIPKLLICKKKRLSISVSSMNIKKAY